MHREMKEVCETLRELNKVVQAENLLMLAVIIQHFNVAMLRELSAQTFETHQTQTADFRLECK